MSKFRGEGHKRPQASPSLARNLRRASGLVLVLLTACASPRDYKFPEHDTGYDEHLAKVKTCSFGDDRTDLYEGYDVGNHILEATELGGVAYRAEGGAEDDFGLIFLRIFNCYRNFRGWRHEQQAEFKQVLIYLNGGLNTASKVRQQAEKQVPLMLEDGYYPIFLIWPTGALDTYLEQITFVRNGTRHRDPQIVRGSLYFGADIGQGLARAPVNYVNQLLRFVGTRNPFDDADKREFLLEPEICRPRDPEDGPSATSIAESEEEVCEETDLSRFGIEDCRVTAERNLMTGRDPDRDPGPMLRRLPYYGLFLTRFLSTPLLDAFGKTMWENMVRRTRTTIRRPIEYDIHLADVYEPEQIRIIEEDKQRFPNGIGAFARFFTMLQYCIAPEEPDPDAADQGPTCSRAADPEVRRFWRDVDLTVIGHSMGTIVMNELIPLHPDLPYRNLVFMAAAASIRDTTRAMSPVISRANAVCPQCDASGGSGDRIRDRDNEAPPRFYNLMLHPKNDADELVAWGAVPSGSLLAWIDEMYEGPKTDIDRTMGKWRNLRAAKHVFPKEAQGNMLLRVFNWDGEWSRDHNGDPRCDGLEQGDEADIHPYRFEPPTTHSGFNDDSARFWCPFFWGADKVGWWGRDTEWEAAVCTSGPDS
jgi:pimeloyl-ACP methyl ester carboxylesterase